MEIKIDGENIRLHFGIKFMNNLDEDIGKTLEQKEKETPYGQGLGTYLELALEGDYKSLAIILYEATCTMENGRPTMEDIYEYIENCDDINSLKNEVLEELKKQEVCMTPATAAEQAAQKTMNLGNRQKRTMKK